MAERNAFRSRPQFKKRIISASITDWYIPRDDASSIDSVVGMTKHLSVVDTTEANAHFIVAAVGLAPTVRAILADAIEHWAHSNGDLQDQRGEVALRLARAINEGAKR